MGGRGSEVLLVHFGIVELEAERHLEVDVGTMIVRMWLCMSKGQVECEMRKRYMQGRT